VTGNPAHLMGRIPYFWIGDACGWQNGSKRAGQTSKREKDSKRESPRLGYVKKREKRDLSKSSEIVSEQLPFLKKPTSRTQSRKPGEGGEGYWSAQKLGKKRGEGVIGLVRTVDDKSRSTTEDMRRERIGGEAKSREIQDT